MQLFCALQKRPILIIWKLTKIFVSPNNFELGQRVFPQIVFHPKTSLGNNFELQQRAYWCVVCSRPWAVRQSMIVCRGWVSKRGKYLTGRLTNIVDKFLANIDAQGRKCCQMPTNIVAILHMSWVGPKPSHRIQMTLWEFSFVRKGLVWKDVWGVCTMYMVKHSFKMSIDSKGISTAEWKCQEQLESRLVFCSQRKKTIPQPTNGQVQNVFLYPFPQHSLSPPTFPPVKKLHQAPPPSTPSALVAAHTN